MSTDSRADGVLVAIAVAVLLIGTATGNAYVMLGLSVAALTLWVAWRRCQFRSRAGLVVLSAAVMAFVVAFVLCAR
jgi:O-antigen ligase